MNYIYILFEIIFTFFLMLVFYKISKKDGLYLYIVLMSSILSIIMFKSIDLFSFQVNPRWCGPWRGRSGTPPGRQAP